MSNNTVMKTLVHCGIQYFDPAEVDARKKEHYWRMSANLMQTQGIKCSLSNINEIKLTFKNLDIGQQQEILQLQRQRLIYLLNNWRFQNHTPLAPPKNDLPLSFITDNMKRLENIQEVLKNYKQTSHSYKNETIADLFQKENRIYIPLEQFLEENEKPGDHRMMVLSRHPYDLFRMATKRHWENCMSHNRENFKRYVPQDIKAGTLIAYAVTSPTNDPYGGDWNISDPSVRCLIKPHICNDNNTLIYKRDRLYGDGTTYNQPFKTAANEITKQWLCREGISDNYYKLENGLYTEIFISGVIYKSPYTSAYPITKDNSLTPDA